MGWFYEGTLWGFRKAVIAGIVLSSWLNAEDAFEDIMRYAICRIVICNNCIILTDIRTNDNKIMMISDLGNSK